MYIMSIINNYSLYKLRGDKYTTWIKTFSKLRAFQKYFSIVERKTTVNKRKINNESIKTISPLRLWDIEYNYEQNIYSFVSLNNEKVIIDGNKTFLWEMASGKKSIYEIYEEAISLKHNLTLASILEFYNKMDDKMAIVYIEF